jgi:transposase
MQQLAHLLEISDLSVYKWMSRFEAAGIEGLKTRPGKRRKRD